MRPSPTSVDRSPAIVHFTTVHPRADIRIRIKEVITLARVWPGKVALFVQDGKGDEIDSEAKFYVHDTGVPERGRIRRMTIGAWRMYRAIRAARPKVAHFHDPELLPWAALLTLSGIAVVYDAHEDLPAATISKPYIRPALRKPLAALVKVVEGILAKRCTAIVAATPAIASNFDKLKPQLVQNFPLLDELLAEQVISDTHVPPHFAYVGGITRIRGAVEMVRAMELVPNQDVRLRMAGSFTSSLGQELEQMRGWGLVEFHGWADRSVVSDMLSRCRAGLVLYAPEPNHIRAQPNKLFEYMSAGLPVIASDFPLWREIVDGARCGLLVDPQDPQAIADAMQWIIDYPAEATEMGRSGRRAVEERFNWEAESASLLALYRRLIPDA